MIEAVRATPKRTRLKRDDRRGLILDSATAIVLGEGMKAATIERVARAINVSKGLIYQHFESRELMLAAVVEREIDVLIARGAFNAIREDGGFDRRLRNALRAIYGYVDERGPLLHLVVAEREVIDVLSTRAKTVWTQAKAGARAIISNEYKLPPAILNDAVELTIAVAAQSARQVAERVAVPALAEDLAASMIAGGLRSLASQYRAEPTTM